MTMPGWYPDPQDRGWLRYYNGRTWTDDRQPALAAPPATQPRADDADRTVPRQSLRAAPTATAPQTYHVTPQAQASYRLVTPDGLQWPPPARRTRRRARVLATLALVLLATLGAGGWVLLHRSTVPQYTFASRKIHRPGDTLARAEQT